MRGDNPEEIRDSGRGPVVNAVGSIPAADVAAAVDVADAVAAADAVVDAAADADAVAGPAGDYRHIHPRKVHLCPW